MVESGWTCVAPLWPTAHSGATDVSRSSIGPSTVSGTASIIIRDSSSAASGRPGNVLFNDEEGSKSLKSSSCEELSSPDEVVPEAPSSIFSKLLQLLVGAGRDGQSRSGTSRVFPTPIRGLSAESDASSHTSVRQLSDWLARR